MALVVAGLEVMQVRGSAVSGRPRYLLRILYRSRAPLLVEWSAIENARDCKYHPLSVCVFGFDENFFAENPQQEPVFSRFVL